MATTVEVDDMLVVVREGVAADEANDEDPAGGKELHGANSLPAVVDTAAAHAADAPRCADGYLPAVQRQGEYDGCRWVVSRSGDIAKSKTNTPLSTSHTVTSNTTSHSSRSSNQHVLCV